MGPPTDLGPWGKARVSKWSVCPWCSYVLFISIHKCLAFHFYFKLYGLF
ncbi:unnamed protein product [Staurois parvus]|uniref:Uncharacterized protein n=1 Tax=Staurois parvus TaxID=386267 RepID=A0ABN9BNW5_9NEOB|nr:unnamed protein product [Staurois parvus]